MARLHWLAQQYGQDVALQIFDNHDHRLAAEIFALYCGLPKHPPRNVLTKWRGYEGVDGYQKGTLRRAAELFLTSKYHLYCREVLLSADGEYASLLAHLAETGHLPGR